jgi:branched-chain amino acid aminotransferase
MAYCFINGQIVDEDSAFVPINNLGVQRGFGVFDFCRVRNGKPTFLKDHLDRFDRSQKFMNLAFSIGRDEIQQAISNLQKKNKFEFGSFKFVLFADGEDSSSELMPFFYIMNAPLPEQVPSPSSKIILHEYLREFPTIKSVSYFNSLLLHQKKRAAKAIDIIYHKDGLVSEASRSNVFIVKDGTLITPKSNVLEGITRKNLLKIAPSILPLEVSDFSADDLCKADEVFISSTMKQVMPIIAIDGKKVGDGKIGPWTSKLKIAYQDLVNLG